MQSRLTLLRGFTHEPQATCNIINLMFDARLQLSSITNVGLSYSLVHPIVDCLSRLYSLRNLDYNPRPCNEMWLLGGEYSLLFWCISKNYKRKTRNTTTDLDVIIVDDDTEATAPEPIEEINEQYASTYVEWTNNYKDTLGISSDVMLDIYYAGDYRVGGINFDIDTGEKFTVWVFGPSYVKFIRVTKIHGKKENPCKSMDPTTVFVEALTLARASA